MSFLEYMISHMEYSDMSTFFGVGRLLMWGITNILVALCGAAEGIYNHIFSVAGLIYNEHVIKFIQNWMGFLWIPIALSLVYLGYSLITGSDVDNNKRVKTFGKNFALLVIVLFAIPYIFIGSGGGNKASLFTNSNYTKYEPNEQLSSGSGLIDIFTHDNGEGIIKGVRGMTGRTAGDGTQVEAIVANNVLDLKTVYLDTLKCYIDGNNQISKEWSKENINKTVRINQFIRIDDGEFHVTNGKGIMDIGINDLITREDLNGDAFGDKQEDREKFHIEDVYVSDYELGYFVPGTANGTLYPMLAAPFDPSFLNFGVISELDNAQAQAAAQNVLSALNDALGSSNGSQGINKIAETNVRDWLFGVKHSTVTRYHDKDGLVVGVLYHNDRTPAVVIIPFLQFLNPYPFRYKVEWGSMLIELIAAFIVLFLTSYKIVRIIYEIIIDQILAVFFGAADLSTGQKTREILKSIFGLILSLFFAVVMIELYFSISAAVKNLEFMRNDGSNNNHWIQAIVTFFIAIAAVKGPSVLEKILGVEGGLSGAWRDVGTATRPARNVAKGAAVATALGAAKVAKGVGKGVGRGVGMGIQHHKGVKQAKLDAKDAPGNSSKFAAKSNRKEKKKKTSEVKTGDGAARNAANADYAAQSRKVAAITKEDYKKNGNAARTHDAYGEDIRKAALAEQTAGRIKGKKISDEQALTAAYENHGFNAADAQRAARSDINSGKFAETKKDFENSVSAQAKMRHEMDPSSYETKHDAYVASAEDHYRAMGFSADEAKQAAGETASKVHIDDASMTIREKAAGYQNTMDSEKPNIEHQSVHEFSDRSGTQSSSQESTQSSSQESTQSGTQHSSQYNNQISTQSSAQDNVSLSESESYSDKGNGGSAGGGTTYSASYREGMSESETLSLTESESISSTRSESSTSSRSESSTSSRSESSSTSSSESHSYRTTESDKPQRMGDREAMEKAVAEYFSDETIISSGANIDTSAAAAQILSQGSIATGPKYGRIAENLEMERAERNTRFGSMSGGDAQSHMNPIMITARMAGGDYMGQKGAESRSQYSYDSGYESSRTKQERKAARNIVRRSKRK